MKNLRIDLKLFGESGVAASDGDNAPDAEVSETSGRVPAEKTVTETLPPLANTDTSHTEPSDTRRIADAAGLDGEEYGDTENVIRTFNSRRARAALRNELRQRIAAENYASLIREAKTLASKIKGFDLSAELKNPAFKKVVSAGLSLEDAFRLCHFNELISASAENAERTALAKFRSVKERPVENGASGQAPAVSKSKVENLTGKGIRDILRRVEKGAKVKF